MASMVSTTDIPISLSDFNALCNASLRAEVLKEEVNKEKLQARTELNANNFEAAQELVQNVKTKEAAIDTIKEEINSMASQVAHDRGVPISTVVKEVVTVFGKSETERVYNMLRAAQTLDLCFVMDATGSMDMGAVFNSVVQSIRDIVGLIQKKNPFLQFQLGLVAYRDVSDGERHFEIVPFTGSISEFTKGLEKITANGGGDAAEDVIGGLEKAVKSMNWKHVNKLIFLSGDAPTHGLDFHGPEIEDWYPKGLGTDARDVIQSIRDNNIQVFFLKLNNSTDKMIDRFNEYAGVPFIATEILDTKNPAQLLKTLMGSVTKSIESSLSRSTTSPALKPRELTTLQEATGVVVSW